MDLPHCEDRMQPGCTVSEIYVSQKRRHGPGWAGPVWAAHMYSAFSDKPRKNSLRSLMIIKIIAGAQAVKTVGGALLIVVGAREQLWVLI